MNGIAGARTFAAIAVALGLLGAPAAFAETVSTTGLVSNGEGTVGHGELAPEPAPYDFADTSVQLGSHPAGAFLASVYTLLDGRDLFDTLDGSVAPLGAHAPPFAGHADAPHDLEGLGIGGTLYYSVRGFELDVTVGDDYNYDLVNNIERRVYRGGSVEFYHDDGLGPVVFARSTDIVMLLSINWNTFLISQVWISSTPDTGPGMLATITDYSGTSANPVQQVGSTTEGAPYAGGYGIFDDEGTTWEFAAIPPVPALPVWGLALLALLLAGAGRLFARAR